MAIVRGTLSALAAVLVGLLGPGLFFALRGINNSKATGLAAVVGGFLESFFSPLFWILAVLFFALFFAASRLSSKPLRILSILDPSYRYFDTRTGHLLAICILMATCQKRVIAKSGEPSLKDFECYGDISTVKYRLIPAY